MSIPMAFKHLGFVVVKTEALLPKDVLEQAGVALDRLGDSIFHTFNDLEVMEAQPDDCKKQLMEAVQTLLGTEVSSTQATSFKFLVK